LLAYQKAYWTEHSAEPTLETMMLDTKAREIDAAERPEIMGAPRATANPHAPPPCSACAGPKAPLPRRARRQLPPAPGGAAQRAPDRPRARRAGPHWAAGVAAAARWRTHLPRRNGLRPRARGAHATLAGG
jgi:hypothetical protein